MPHSWQPHRHEWVIDRQVDRLYPPTMPHGLKRYQQTGHLHFITFSCHHRLPFLLPDHPKHVFEQTLEHLRQTHGFDLHGYVLMPEHVHLLLSEPTHHSLDQTLKVLKQQTSKQLIGSRDHFWQPRYYDFNVRTPHKRLEKLRYMHQNPVKRGLITRPEDYPWSSALHHSTGATGTLYLTSPRNPTIPPETGAPFMTAPPS